MGLTHRPALIAVYAPPFALWGLNYCLALFRYVLMGAKEKVLENTGSIYSCLLCKMCEENCPAGVHIAENVRSLRVYINKEVYGL